jgi:hypothetical protein
MTIIKKASIAQEIYPTTGQSLTAIKEELEGLQEIMDNVEYGTHDYYRSVSRYWGIRWVMDWEKEIPQ